MQIWSQKDAMYVAINIVTYVRVHSYCNAFTKDKKLAGYINYELNKLLFKNLFKQSLRALYVYKLGNFWRVQFWRLQANPVIHPNCQNFPPPKFCAIWYVIVNVLQGKPCRVTKRIGRLAGLGPVKMLAVPCH